eukprot:m.92937 g.92937  ORF g.92937 m.92937 type:complete len:57 (-) comp16526_c0_seq4:2457-2627(-)
MVQWYIGMNESTLRHVARGDVDAASALGINFLRTAVHQRMPRITVLTTLNASAHCG